MLNKEENMAACVSFVFVITSRSFIDNSC